MEIIDNSRSNDFNFNFHEFRYFIEIWCILVRYFFCLRGTIGSFTKTPLSIEDIILYGICFTVARTT